jgi:hypothetical protein
MFAEKQSLTLADIEAQTALELPARETPQTVIVQCLAICIGQIVLRNIDVAVALNLCVQLEAIRVGGVTIFECNVTGNPNA